MCSYNCGALSNHYDYLRAVAMSKLMEERYAKEPGAMAFNEEIQKRALKARFSNEKYLPEAPSFNLAWSRKSDEMITTYHVRPVVIYDKEVEQMLDDHLRDLCKKNGERDELLQEARSLMAKRIFAHHLKFDILCLQEADYLDESLFPPQYEVLFSHGDHSKNGVAWNTERFELVEPLGEIERVFAVKLLDRQTSKSVVVLSAHLSGCNPYVMGADSAKGDSELRDALAFAKTLEADYFVIGMDSNVTSLHPRLGILKDANYTLDYENYLEPTCTNPYYILNTRIDWIALKLNQEAKITNIPVLGVGLNSLETNISDHKPIAAKIEY